MSKRRALIIDDNDFYASKLQNYFENFDFQIDRAYMQRMLGNFIII